jgi:hypothetical protein
VNLYTACPRIEFTRGTKFFKNFRGITFFASPETPISVIQKFFQHRSGLKSKKIQKKKIPFFLKKSNDH